MKQVGKFTRSLSKPFAGKEGAKRGSAPMSYAKERERGTGDHQGGMATKLKVSCVVWDLRALPVVESALPPHPFPPLQSFFYAK